MNRYAILIGASSFPQGPKTLGSLNLVRNQFTENYFESALRKASCDAFDVTSLLDREVRDITDTFERIMDSSQPDDFCLLYYFGHARHIKELGPLSLATIDSKDTPTPYRDLELRYLDSRLRSANKARVLIILDCLCTEMKSPFREAPPAGLLPPDFIEATIASGDAQEPDEQRADASRGVFLLMACPRVQTGSPETADGHGDLTAAVITALESSRDHGLTVRRLYEQVTQAMRQSVRAPVLFCRGEADPTLTLIDPPLIYHEHPVDDDASELWHDEPLTTEEVLRLQHAAPTYLLDSKFHFKDWNPAFDDIVAKQIGLTRGALAGKFIKELANRGDVTKRADAEFKRPDDAEQARCDQTGEIPSSLPSVDIERLEFVSKRFGLLVFDKLATQVRGSEGPSKTWCVNLNVAFAQRHKQFWDHMKSLAENEERWTQYAKIYDSLVGSYPLYRELVDKVVEHIGDSRNCVDVGAGTGNVTIELLRKAYRHVTALENNDAMLARLWRKLKAEDAFRGRYTIIKGDATINLQHLCQQEQTAGAVGRFDACMMLNVLFVVENPMSCLEAAFKILKPGGILSIANPRRPLHPEQNEGFVDELFAGIRKHLEETKQWDPMEDAWRTAYQRNKEMIAAATKYSADELVRFIVDAGFCVADDDITDNLYNNCVVVIKAVKPTNEPLPIRVPGPDSKKTTNAELKDPIGTKEGKKHVFLSYCHDYKEEVTQLRKDLIAAEETVWWDQDIRGGQLLTDAIREAMKKSVAVVLCLSKELDNRRESGVYPEILDAIRVFRRTRPGSAFLIPVRLSVCKVPSIPIDDLNSLDQLKCIDLYPAEQREEGLKDLLAAIDDLRGQSA